MLSNLICKMATFVPDAAHLGQVLQMLQCALAPDTALQKQAQAALTQHSSNPNFVLYLAYIFVRHTAAGLPVQHIAGLTLKRAIDTGYKNLSVDIQRQVQLELLQGLAHNEVPIRNTAANAISAAARSSGLASWRDLPQHMCAALDSSSEAAQQGALLAVSMLAEDTGHEWADTDLGRPIDAIVPRLLRWMQAPNPRQRLLATQAMYNFAHAAGGDIKSEMYSEYLRVLAALTSETGAAMKECVIKSFGALVLQRWHIAAPFLQPVAQFVLAAMNSSTDDESVVKAACNFWDVLVEALKDADNMLNRAAQREDDPAGTAWPATSSDWQRRCVTENLDLLDQFLPVLVPSLLRRMVYSDEDLANLSAHDRGEATATPGGDREEDIRPHIHRARGSEAAGDGAASTADADDADDGEGDGGDRSDPHAEVKEFTVRQAAAASLEALALDYGQKILSFLLPELQTRLQQSNDPSRWRDRELCVLALGCIADGCSEDMAEHLPRMYPYLLHLTKDPMPLVRAISCWALGKYSRWIMEQHLSADDAGEGKYLGALIGSLCHCMADANGRVQRSASTAMYCLAEETMEMAAEFAPMMVDTFMHCLQSYGLRNRMHLYDVIGECASNNILSEVFDSDTERTTKMLNLLMGCYSRLKSNDDPELIPLFECLSHVAPVMGVFFAPACGSIFMRCVQILQTDLVMAQVAMDINEPLPDLTRMCASLDLINAMIEAVGDACSDAVAQSGLADLLLKCMQLKDKDVRLSGFILLGDLCDIAWSCLAPFAEPLAKCALEVIGNYLRQSAIRTEKVNTCNNACWALGKMALNVGAPFASAVPAILPLMVSILNRTNSNPILVQNSAWVVGILAENAPAAVISTPCEQPAGAWPGWCTWWLKAVGHMKDDSEKEQACKGICKVVLTNPAASAPALPYLAMCFAAAFEPSPPQQLRTTMSQILNQYRSAIPQDQWRGLWNQWNPVLQNKLQSVFGVGP